MTSEALPTCEGCGKVPTFFDVWEVQGGKLKKLRDELIKFDPDKAEVLLQDNKPPKYSCGCCLPLMTAEEYAEYNKTEKRKRAELGFVFRVRFCDNDFGAPVERACTDFMHTVTHGHSNSEGLEKALEEIEHVGMENLRKFIVMTAFSYCVANAVERWLHEMRCGSRHKSDPYKLEQYKDTLQYLDRNISLEIATHDPDEWENGEVCYVDLTNRVVQLH